MFARKKTGLCMLIWSWIWTPALLLAQPGFTYMGFNYPTFQQGQLPYSQSWQVQDFFNSQAIQAAEVGTGFACTGNAALRLSVQLQGGHPNLANGEVFVDMRQHPPGGDTASCLTAPLNLQGSPLSVQVYCPAGLGGETSAPNGFQLFVKDAQWRSFYGSWTNIAPLSDTCHTVWLTPDTLAPAGGFMSEGFDPTQIIAVGLKIGANSSWTGSFSGEVWLDEVRWEEQSRYGFEHPSNALEQMTELPVNTASLVLTWYMEAPYSTQIWPHPQKSATLEEIAQTIDSLHARGMKVMLKPHVDVLDGSWRGLIDPADPGAWFESYRQFVGQLAALGAEKGVELFCVGTEFSTMEAFRAEWEAVIAQTRNQLPDARLVYAANWDAFLSTPFWDLLDLIGVDAYFPLGGLSGGTVEQLSGRWSLWKDFLKEVADSVQKPVLFTEIGYASHAAAVQTPWLGCAGFVAGSCPFEHNCALQARAYTAAMRAFCNEPWFAGMLFWNWEPTADAGGCCNRNFTPQNKPLTLESFYRPHAFDDTLLLSCGQNEALLDALANDCGSGLRIEGLSQQPEGLLWETNNNQLIIREFPDSSFTFSYQLANEWNSYDTARVWVQYRWPDRDGDLLADCVDREDCGCEDLMPDLAAGLQVDTLNDSTFRFIPRLLQQGCDSIRWEWGDGSSSTSVGKDTVIHIYSTGSPASLCINVKRQLPGGGEMCENTSCQLVGLAPAEKTIWHIYPNPTHNLLHVAHTGPTQAGAVQLRLIDLSGRSRKVISLPAGRSKHVLDLSELPAALYLLRLTTRDGRLLLSRRILKL